MNYRRILLILLIIFSIMSCASAVHISEIKKQPNAYHDQFITLSGVVEEVITMPVLGIGVYQMNDGTGTLWVKPNRKTPYKGSKVKVSGELKVGFTFSGQSFGLILIENDEQEK